MTVRTVGNANQPFMRLATPTTPTGAHADLRAMALALGDDVATTSFGYGTFDGNEAGTFFAPSLPSAAGAVTINSVAQTVELVVVPGGFTIAQAMDFGSRTADNAIVVVRVLGDLTILAGAQVSTPVRKRGLFFVVDGTFRNFGIASMTGKGSKAIAGAALRVIGTDTILATAAAGATAPASGNNGTTGTAGSSRSPGGGGSGASRGGIGGNGAAGNGFTGGSGGAGCHTAGAGAASVDGGKGGHVDGNTSSGATSGAGNPPGVSGPVLHTIATEAGSHLVGGYAMGTGGLLGIIAWRIVNESGGVICSDGMPGNYPTGVDGAQATDVGFPGGGGSGGGSVNLWYDDTHTNNGTERANGGAAGNSPGAATYRGGPGGAGSVTATAF